jgi:hypothetical protein
MRHFIVALLIFALPFPAFASVARDAKATGSSSPITISPTVDGTMDFVVSVNVSGTNTCSAATVGGTSMTLEDHTPGVSGQIGPVYIFNVATTTTTTAALSITVTCTGGIGFIAASDYTGVNQSTPVDSHNNALYVNGATSPFSATTTTTIANDWLVGIINSSAFDLSAGTNTNLLEGASPAYFDGGPFTSTGSNSLQATWTGGTQYINYAIVAIEPAPAPASSVDLSDWWPFFTW